MRSHCTSQALWPLRDPSSSFCLFKYTMLMSISLFCLFNHPMLRSTKFFLFIQPPDAEVHQVIFVFFNHPMLRSTKFFLFIQPSNVSGVCLNTRRDGCWHSSLTNCSRYISAAEHNTAEQYSKMDRTKPRKYLPRNDLLSITRKAFLEIKSI